MAFVDQRRLSAMDDDPIAQVMATFLNVRPAPSVDAQPLVDLFDWRVIKDGVGERHLYGMLNDGETCRMSTAIVAFDAVQRSWITSSGRKYQTHGEPGDAIEREAFLFLAWHYRLLGNPVDVTDEIWRAMREARQ